MAIFAAGVGGKIIRVTGGDQFLEDGPHGAEVGFLVFKLMKMVKLPNLSSCLKVNTFSKLLLGENKLVS